MKVSSIFITLFLLSGAVLADDRYLVDSVASGWFDSDRGTRFFDSAEELCGSGAVDYESYGSAWLAKCNSNWRIVGVLGFVCPSGYLPAGYPAFIWRLGWLKASSGFGVAEDGYVYAGWGPGGFNHCFRSGQFQVALTGPVETKPRNTGNWRELMMTATVRQGDAPVSGKVVRFTITPKTAGDGHVHGLNGKPVGTISNGSTNASGELKSAYLPPEFAGVYTIEATCDGCANKAALDVTVRVPDLVKLGPDSRNPSRYTLVGETVSHPGSHYFSKAAHRALDNFIDVLIKQGWTNIGLNDSSLDWGGRFDIGAGWGGSHHEHREGDEVDVSFYRPQTTSVELRSKTYIYLSKGKRFESPHVLWHINDNPTTGSKAHFHVYLLGQKTSFTTRY